MFLFASSSSFHHCQHSILHVSLDILSSTYSRHIFYSRILSTFLNNRLFWYLFTFSYLLSNFHQLSESAKIPVTDNVSRGTFSFSLSFARACSFLRERRILYHGFSSGTFRWCPFQGDVPKSSLAVLLPDWSVAAATHARISHYREQGSKLRPPSPLLLHFMLTPTQRP